MITDRQIISLSLQKNGSYRARFRYKLTSGKDINVGPVGVEDQDRAYNKLLELEPDILQKEQERDAEKAVASNNDTARGEASQNQVHLAWLRKAYRENDHYKAYIRLKRVISDVLASGATQSEYADYLGITENEFIKIKNYWQFLNTNKAVIIAYGELAGGKG